MILRILLGSSVVNNGTLTTDSGGTIDNEGDITNDDILTNSGALNNTGNMNNNDSITNNIGTIDNDGTITNNAGGIINNSFGNIINDGEIINNGTITNDGFAGTLDINNNGEIINNADIDNFGGTLNVNNGGLFLNEDGTINNRGGGTINVNAGGNLTSTVGSTLTNDGTGGIINNFGTFDNAGAFNNDDEFDNESGGTLNNTGTITNDSDFDNAGTLNNNAGGTITNNDLVINFEIINNAGTITNAATGHFASGDTINNNNGGTINNAGAFNNDDILNNNNGGTITNSGSDFNNGGTLNNNAGGTITNDNDFDNFGTLDGTINNNGTITNNASFDNTGATVNIQCGGIFTGTIDVGNTMVDACAPVATAASISTSEDNGVAFILNGTNPDADPDFAALPLQFSIVADPGDGSLSGSNASRTYTPDGNFSGLDSFTFRANDGTNDSPAATITITINAVNDLPVANAQSVTTDEDTAKAITLAGSDPVEGSALTFSVVTQPSSGTLSGTAPNLTYTPNADFNGADSFTFVANDGTDNSTAATVSITVNPVDEPEEDDGGSGGGGGGGDRVVIVNPQDDESTITYPESHFEENPLDRIQVSNFAFLDLSRVSISHASVGQQVIITGTLANHLQVEQDYAFIVQITNDQGVVFYVGWQLGMITSGQTIDVSVSWTPVEGSGYTATVFVLDGMGAIGDSPILLSRTSQDNLQVTE